MELAGLIVDEARAQGVPPDVALAFAVAESNVANVVGDKQLYKRAGYMERVEKVHPTWRSYSSASDWVSYGPFQLQALWHLRPGEEPRDLVAVETSVPRAIAYIRRQLDKYGGDPDEARLAYVCGAPSVCSPEKRERILRRYAEAEIVARDFLQWSDDEVDDDDVPENVLLAGAFVALVVWRALRDR